ncbi:hypothetical protein EE612_055508, partial [Oryza sativa]
LKTTIKSTL